MKAIAQVACQALIEAYVARRQKCHPCFQPKVLGAYKVNMTLGKNLNTPKPKWEAKAQVTQTTTICNPRGKQYWDFFGVSQPESIQIDI